MADDDATGVERALLGLLLNGPPADIVTAVAELVSVASFTDPRHRELFTTIGDLQVAGAPVTVASVDAALRKGRRLRQAGGPVYLVETANEWACTAPQATWHAQRLAALAELRDAPADAAALNQAADTGDLDALRNVRARLADKWAGSTVIDDDPAARAAAALAREVTEQRTRRQARSILDAEERPPARRPEVLTLRERLARPRDLVAYRVDGWQPVGSRVMLAAQRKAGKTTAVGNLLRSLVDGDPWLGRWKVDPIGGTAVLLDLEMSAMQLDDWLGAQGIAADDQVIPVPLRGNAAALDLIDPGRRGEWAAELRRLGCGYLVLDCLRPALDALGLDEHSEAGRFLVAFDALLAEAAVPEAAVVHHMGHDGKRSRGDSRIRDWPDAEWRLVRQDPDDDASPRYLSAYGRDVDQRELRLAYDSAARRLTVGEGSRNEFASSVALDAVLAALGSEPRQSLRDLEMISASTAHSRQTIREATKAGVRAGLIVAESGPRRSILHSLAATADTLPEPPP